MLESPSSDTSAIAGQRTRPGLTLLLIAGIQLMLVLDATIVNVALPRMGGYFDKSQTDMTWAISAYSLAFGGFLLLGGRAGDLFGRRRMLGMGLALFTLGSLAGGLATSFPLLVGGRAAQGLGGALAAPAALALLTAEFAAGKERTRALAVYSSIQGSGGALGLLLGGFLTEYFSWRWVLFVNVPLGALLIAGVFAWVRPTPRVPGRFDVLGAVLSTGGMTALVYGFISAAKPGYGWDHSLTLGSFATAVFLLLSFVLVESRTAHPMLPLRILRDRNRAGAYIAMLAISAGLAGQFYFVTYFFQLVLGFSALQNGFACIPVGITVMIGAFTSGRLLPKIGARGVVAVGAAFSSAGLFWLSTVDADTTYATTFLPAMLLFAFGCGNTLVPLTTAAVSAVREADMGVASAVLNVAGNLGGAIGISALATVFSSSLTSSAKDQVTSLTSALSNGSASPTVLEHFGQVLQKAFDAPAAALRDSTAVHAVHSALADATGTAFVAAGLMIVFGGVVAVALIRTRTTEDATVSST